MDGMGRGPSERVLGADGLAARSAMQVGLLRSILWLISAAAAVLATLLSLGAVIWSYRRGAPIRFLGLAFFCALVLLITKAALDLGGARGSALSFGFIPGFLAVLVLGPGLGWFVCALMLLSFAGLAATTALPLPYDVLRFVD